MDAGNSSLRHTRLHAALPALSQVDSFRDLCRGTVEIATRQLGLQRVSFWSVADDGETLQLICTAVMGEVTDSDLRVVRRAGPGPNEFPVRDDNEVVGYLMIEATDDSPVSADDMAVATILADTVGNLARRVTAEETMLELYRITSESSLSPEERIEKLMRMGLDRFDLEIAILARVVKGRYEVVQVVAPEELGLLPGMRFDLEGTFCRETLGALGPVGFTMAEQSNWASHPAYLAFGLEAYFGTPVRVGDEVYGTLNFSSRAPRAKAYTSFELKLIQLMARWVQVELENERHQKQAREHEALIAEQSRTDSAGELATNIAHELNQPLAALVTLAEAAQLAIQAGSTEHIEGDLLELRKQAHRASGIMRSLRKLIRRETAPPTNCRIRDLVQLVRQALSHELRDADVELLADLHDDETFIEVDRVQAEQALRNLVQNSIHAVNTADPPQRRVTIATGAGETRDVVWFTVTDTGQLADGVDPERVLEPFYTTKESGLGLGLAIFRSVVEAHGGQINTDRTDEGGLRVRFTLS